MKNINRVMRAGSVGAAISTVLLIGMVFITLPAGMSYPGLEALTGSIVLSAGEKNAFLTGMQTLYILDGVFLMGWILAWVGLSELVRERSKTFGLLTLIFGLAGALFDLSENSIIWGVLQSMQLGTLSGNAWLIPWKAVQHMSYWLPFSGAILAACGLWSRQRLDQITAIAGTVLTAGAIAGLYLPAISLLSNLWFLIWFASLACLLWRRSTETRS